MPMLRFVIKRDVRPSGRTCVLSQGDIEAAQKSISKAIDVVSDKSHQRGKYNSYTLEQRARIGKYATKNGATCAAKHFTAAWGISISEFMARRLKSEYLMKRFPSEKTSRMKIPLPGNLLLLKCWKLRREAGHCCWAKNWMQLFRSL